MPFVTQKQFDPWGIPDEVKPAPAILKQYELLSLLMYGSTDSFISPAKTSTKIRFLRMPLSLHVPVISTVSDLSKLATKFKELGVISKADVESVPLPKSVQLGFVMGSQVLVASDKSEEAIVPPQPTRKKRRFKIIKKYADLTLKLSELIAKRLSRSLLRLKKLYLVLAINCIKVIRFLYCFLIYH